MDEVHPLQAQIYIDRKANRIEMVRGLKKKRAYSIDGTDLVKYVAFEGSSLTLLGLVNYDPQKDSFSMTELSAVLSGGIEEARKGLSQRLRSLRFSYFTLIVIAGCLLGSGIVLQINIWRHRRR